MHKTYIFSYNFPFVFWFIALVDIIGIKSTPGDYESNLKKVGAIPCGCSTMWTLIFSYHMNLIILFDCNADIINSSRVGSKI